jgi:hypothetical protein
MNFGFGFSCSVRVLLTYFCAVSDWRFGVSPAPMAGRQVVMTGGRVCVWDIMGLLCQRYKKRVLTVVGWVVPIWIRISSYQLKNLMLL